MDKRKRGPKYRSCFSGPEGSEVLLDILTECGVFSVTDPTDIAANAERNVAVRIAARAGLNPGDYVDLMRAATKDGFDERRTDSGNPYQF